MKGCGASFKRERANVGERESCLAGLGITVIPTQLQDDLNIRLQSALQVKSVATCILAAKPFSVPM